MPLNLARKNTKTQHYSNYPMQEKMQQTTEKDEGRRCDSLLLQIIGAVLSDRARVWSSVSLMPRKGCIAHDCKKQGHATPLDAP